MAANNIYIQVDFNSQNAQQNVNALNNAIAQTGPTAEKSSKQATTGLNSISVSVQQVNREFSQLTSAIAGLGISRVLGGIVQMSAELSRTQAAMQSFTGSAEEANKVFEQIRAIAAQSPFRFKDLEETAQRLLGFGMAAKTVPDTLKTITDQAARMGTGLEGVNTVVNVFGRIMEKNFVGAMDLMRALPAQGIPALKALGDAMSKELGRPVDIEETKKALKDGLFDPLQTIRVLLDSMKQKGDAGKFSDDAARAFKNLADTVDNVLTKLFGPQGFGPALKNLGDEIGKILAPLGGLVDYLMKLPEGTKEIAVNVAAAAAAFAAFGTALAIVVNLASPLASLTASIVKFTASLVAMDPELAIAIALLGALGVAAYNLIPQFKALTDNIVGGLTDKIKTALSGLAEQGKKFMAGIFKGGQGLDPGKLLNTDDLFKTLLDQTQKLADAGKRVLLEALSSPAEAVELKYADLFTKLKDQMKDLSADQQKALTDVLKSGEAAELEAARFKEQKQQIDDLAKYQIEKTKGSYDAQIAYIEAQDHQNLRQKVADIDKIAELRTQSAHKVADIENDQLQQVYDAQIKMLEDVKKQGIDVSSAEARLQADLINKQKLNTEKANDEEQKYRLEGWKKANDAIIEDQKRVFDAFKSEFDQIFDILTGNAKDKGKAMADEFKKLALGEARNIFSTTLAQGATAAAGYGWPEAQIGRSGGVLSALFMRGMPPRPPGAPPEIWNPARGESGVSYDAQSGANRFAVATDAYSQSTVLFAKAVEHFAGATVSTKGSADRMADSADSFSDATDAESAMLAEIRRRESGGNYGAQNTGSTASGAYQFINKTWRMATQATGIGGQYPTAAAAPQSVQDTNALWLLRQYGPNSTASWAASGPYATPSGPSFLQKLFPGVSLPSGAQTQKFFQQLFPGVPYLSPKQAQQAQQFLKKMFPSAAPTGLPPSALTYGAGLEAPGFDTTAPAAGGAIPYSAWPSLGVGGGGGGSVGPEPPGFDTTAAAAGGPSTVAANAQLATILAGAGPSRPSPFANLASSFANLRNFVINPKIWNATGTSFGAYAGSVATSPAATMVGSLLATGGLLGNQRGTGGGILMGTAGGALLGAGIGAQFGPEGALIGAGVGTAVGFGIGLGEMLAGVESPRNQAKRLARQLYHITINNATADQIVALAQQSFGGNVGTAMRSPQVRQMLGVYAAGTGQAGSFNAGSSTPHGATLVEQGGSLYQAPTYEYGNAYSYGSNLPIYGGQPTHVLGAPGGGMQLSLNIAGQDAAKFLQGNVVSPDVVQGQYQQAMQSSTGRVAQALLMSEPGSIVG